MNKIILFLVGMMYMCTSAADLMATEAHPSMDNLLSSSSESMRCIECHDEILIKDDKAPMQYRGWKTVNRPIGFSYRDYANMMGDSYVSITNLDSRIKLEAGDDVGCIACHELRTDLDDNNLMKCRSTGKLTVGPKKSDLCFSCHIK